MEKMAFRKWWTHSMSLWLQPSPLALTILISSVRFSMIYLMMNCALRLETSGCASQSPHLSTRVHRYQPEPKSRNRQRRHCFDMLWYHISSLGPFQLVRLLVCADHWSHDEIAFVQKHAWRRNVKWDAYAAWNKLEAVSSATIQSAEKQLLCEIETRQVGSDQKNGGGLYQLQTS